MHLLFHHVRPLIISPMHQWLAKTVADLVANGRVQNCTRAAYASDGSMAWCSMIHRAQEGARLVRIGLVSPRESTRACERVGEFAAYASTRPIFHLLHPPHIHPRTPEAE